MWVADNNTRIFGLQALYPNARVIDWNGLSAQVAGDLTTSDGGAHLKTEKAKQYYANIIFDAIGRPTLEKPIE